MATVTIQKRENKNGNSYVVTYKDPLTGVKKYYKTFRKKHIAQQEANELRALLDTGISPKQRKKKITTKTFGEVSEQLQKEWSDLLMEGNLAQKTFQEYSIWLNVLNRKFGNRMLCNITKNDIVEFRNKKAEEYSNISANKYLSIIKRVFKIGKKLNAVVVDPAEGISMLSEKEHERNRFILPHEIDLLIESAKKVRAKHYLPAMIYLGAEHGASKQEILSLVWSDIDFNFMGNGLIRLFRTKNKMIRTDRLMPRTKMALMEWKEHLKFMRHRKKISTLKSDHVFCHLNGSPIKNFNKAWWEALAIAGIEDFHFHDLRHTFCSNLILSGSSLKEVKEMIGHSDISMTDRYSHLTDSHKEHKQNLLAEYYESKN